MHEGSDAYLQPDGGSSCDITSASSCAEAQLLPIVGAIDRALTTLDPSSLLVVIINNRTLYEALEETPEAGTGFELVLVEKLNKGTKPNLKRRLAKAKERRTTNEPISMDSLGSMGGKKEDEKEKRNEREERKEGSGDGEDRSEGGATAGRGGDIAVQDRTLVLDANVCPGNTGGFILEHLPAAGAYVGIEGVSRSFSVLYLHAVQLELLAPEPSDTGEDAPCRARLLALAGSPPALVRLLPPPTVQPTTSGDTQILRELEDVLDRSQSNVVFATADQIAFLRCLSLAHVNPSLIPLLVYTNGHSAGLRLDTEDLDLRREQWGRGVWIAEVKVLHLTSSACPPNSSLHCLSRAGARHVTLRIRHHAFKVNFLSMYHCPTVWRNCEV